MLRRQRSHVRIVSGAPNFHKLIQSLNAHAAETSVAYLAYTLSPDRVCRCHVESSQRESASRSVCREFVLGSLKIITEKYSCSRNVFSLTGGGKQMQVNWPTEHLWIYFPYIGSMTV